MFDADRPILNSTQDKLGRAVFAKYLARCILHQNPESLVVGLYGSWGVGKTSVINLVLEELQVASSNSLDEQKPIILNFSPWSYSGQNQLIYHFFRRLSAALRHVDYLENAERIIYLLELYVSFFTEKPIPDSLRLSHSTWANLMGTYREEPYGWESGRDLTQVKAELNALLKKQEHKIIIMIDNISRLYDYEIKQIFQIVKSMGDYANTTYLLAFDKAQAIQAINNIDGSGGNDLIEKIVQMSFDIPPISQQDLEAIFTDRVNIVIQMVPEEAWDAEYWSDIYYSSLKYFFNHCRDITRYINALHFSYPRLRDIVNPVDFFILTAIEVFMPALYMGLRDNKDLFTGSLDHVYPLTPEKIHSDQARCNEIIARDKRVSTDIIIELLIHLFPRIRKLYRPEIPFYHSDAIARKLLRLCSPDMFDAYFRLSIQSVQISSSEFTFILSTAKDEIAFDHAITRLIQNSSILKFLDLLDSKTLVNLPIEDIQPIITALLDNGDLFPYGEQGLLSLSTPMRLHRIIHALLQRLEITEDRFIVLQNAIAKTTKSLYSIVHELTVQGRQHQETADTYLPLAFRDLTPDQLISLRKLAVSRIEAWAKSGSLIEHPKLMPILFAWREWGDAQSCQHFVQQMVQSDKGLLTFLTTFFAVPIIQAMEEYKKDTLWEKSLEDIALFIPTQELELHAKVLFEDPYFEKLREKEQLSLMIFLDVMKSFTQKTIPQTSV